MMLSVLARKAACWSSLGLWVFTRMPINAMAEGAFLSSEPAAPDVLHSQEIRPLIAAAGLQTALDEDHRHAVEARTGRLAELLRPIFVSLPKNAHGNVAAPGVRYALHRLFLQQHGWNIKGLEPDGKAWASELPTKALVGVPQQVKELFEGHLSVNGLGLSEIAFFGAMIEHMVHGEAHNWLRAIYSGLGHSVITRELNDGQAKEVIDAFMAIYILGKDTSDMTFDAWQMLNVTIEEQHSNWPETKMFLREVQREVRGGLEWFSFSDVSAVVEAAADRFGRWQTYECHALKDQLIKLEERPGTGRVRLLDFYSSNLQNGQWQFGESLAYLRQLGAVDDSEPEALRVIIPNYINSPANCLTSSSFYAVCCIDPCDDILGHLERQIRAPSATPEDILAALVSEPTKGNWTPSEKLLSRLGEVADHHGGHAPLHGRLFMQWLHHAFPQDCPYPHVSGTTRPQRPDDWELETNTEAMASQDEMLQHIQGIHRTKKSFESEQAGNNSMCSTMWSMEEELVDPHGFHQVAAMAYATGDRGEPAQRMLLRGIALLAAVASLFLALAKTLGPLLRTSKGKSVLPLQTHFV